MNVQCNRSDLDVGVLFLQCIFRRESAFSIHLPLLHDLELTNRMGVAVESKDYHGCDDDSMKKLL